VGLERGPLSLVRIIEELLEWKSSGSKLALTSPTGCGRSVGVVRLRTKTTEFSLVISSIFVPDVYFGNLLLNTLGLWPSCNGRDQISCPFKKLKGKIIDLYVIMVHFNIIFALALLFCVFFRVVLRYIKTSRCHDFSVSLYRRFHFDVCNVLSF
jgi:hypothetical protein